MGKMSTQGEFCSLGLTMPGTNTGNVAQCLGSPWIHGHHTKKKANTFSNVYHFRNLENIGIVETNEPEK